MSRQSVSTPGAPAAIGPYSQGIRTGELVFTAGQVGADPSTGELADGVAAQADRALRNLTAILDAAGVSLDRVVKTTIFLTDVADFAAVNEVYATFVGDPPPARATVEVRGLPRAALVEIDAVAYVGGRGA